MAAALGLPILLLAGSGLRLRWWAGTVSLLAGAAITITTLQWANSEDRVGVQSAPYFMAGAGVLIGMLGILLLCLDDGDVATDKKRAR